jgi:hypothetical protein
LFADGVDLSSGGRHADSLGLDLAGEVELGGEVGVGGFDSGVFLDDERLGEGLAGGGQADGVAGGWGPGAGGAAEGTGREAFGGGVVKVPDETVEAGGGGRGRW